MSGKFSDKDIAFLWAVIENGGKSNVSEINDVTEENPAVATLDNPAINYRCRRLGFEGTKTVDGLGIVKVSPGGYEENGQHAPKVVELVDESVVDEVMTRVENGEAAVGQFDTVEEAFSHLLEQVGDIDASVKEQERKFEALADEFNPLMKRIQEVIKEEHGVDIGEAMREAQNGK